jgi:putative spermidine/putrescine transport system ATP-binding protein
VILGREGTFTVRPEKIRMVDRNGAGPSDDECSATGVVTDVAYLGAETRYTVTLDAGDELVVTEQNLTTKSTDALAARDRPVRLLWGKQYNRLLPD